MPCLTEMMQMLKCLLYGRRKTLSGSSANISFPVSAATDTAALRWELPNWVGGVPFKITSMMELMALLIEQGKIKLDKSVWAGKRFTYHDSCNIARSGGIIEEPRTVIRAAVG